MKNRILQLVFSFLICCAAFGSSGQNFVNVTGPTANTSVNIGMGSSNFIKSVQFYTPQELGIPVGASISSIALSTSAPASPNLTALGVNVYIANLDSDVDVIAYADNMNNYLSGYFGSTSVTPNYTGSWAFTAANLVTDGGRSWYPITLTNPVTYQGRGLIVIINRETSVSFAGFTFRSAQTAGNSCVRQPATTAIPATTNLPATGFRPMLRFGFSNVATVTNQVFSIAERTSAVSGCSTATTTLALSSNNTRMNPAPTYQWESAVDNNGTPGTYSDVLSATTSSITPADLVPTWYRLKVSDGTNTVTTNAILYGSYSISNPSGVDGSRCGTGSVSLSATGSNVKWYPNSGGVSINSGNNFSPSVSSTTTYKAVDQGNADIVGSLMTTFHQSSTASQLNFGYFTGFIANTSYYNSLTVSNPNGIVLKSVDFAPSGSGTYVIQAQSSDGSTVVGSYTGTVSAGQAYDSLITAPVNFYLPAGTYRIKQTQQAGGSSYWQTGVAFPYTISGQVSITGQFQEPATNLGNVAIYLVNFRFSNQCLGSTNVTATVSSPPALTINSSVPSGYYCEADAPSSKQMTLTPDHGSAYTSFSWSPSGPGTGLASADANNEVVTVNPTSTTTYTLLASDAFGCAISVPYTVTVNPSPSVSFTTSQSGNVCPGTSFAVTTVAVNNKVKQLGTGNLSNGNFMRGLFSSTRTQMLYTASEMTAAGFAGAGNISKLWFNITTKASTTGFNNFAIKIANTNLTSMSGGMASPSFTTVYSVSSYTTSVGWNEIPFQNNFTWDGTSNIIVEFCFFNTTSAGGNDVVEASSVANSVVFNTESGGVNACGMTNNDGIVATRPNIRLNGGAIPTFSWQPAAIFDNPNVKSPTITVGSTLGTQYDVFVTVSDGTCEATSNTISYTVSNSAAAPVIATTNSSNICDPSSVTLTYTGSAGNIRWESAADPAGPWTEVAGESNDTLVTPVLSAPISYRAKTVCTGADPDAAAPSNALTFNVRNFSAPTSAGGVRCGQGTVSLSATGSDNGTLRWVDSTKGGVLLTTGSSYTTPLITSTKSYGLITTNDLVAATTLTTNPSATAGAANSSLLINATFGMKFDVLNDKGIILNSVDMPFSTTGTNFTITIFDKNFNAVAVLNRTSPASTSGLQTVTFGNVWNHTVPLNVYLPKDTSYYIIPTDNSVGFLASTTTGTTYPYTVPGVISIVGNNRRSSFANPQSTTADAAWYYFWNWNVSSGCISPVGTATATVNTPPAITLVPNVSETTVCAGTPVNLNANSAGYSNYSWSPSAGLSNANIANPVATPSVTTTYTVTAHDGNPDLALRCTNTRQITIVVNSRPTINLGVNPTTVCLGSPAQLQVQGASTYRGQIGSSTVQGLNSSIFGTATNRTQILYTAAEMNAAGFTSAGFLSAVAFQMQFRNSTSDVNQMTIKMANVSATDLASGTFLTDPTTTVYNSVVTPIANSWVNIPLTTNFLYDGTSSLLIEVCNVVPTGSNDFLFCSTASPAKLISSATGCGAATGTATTNRVNIRLVGGPVTYNWLTSDPAFSATNIANPTYTATSLGAKSFNVEVVDVVGCNRTTTVNFTAVLPGTWIGGTSTDFANAANWQCGVLPDATTNVSIPGPAVTTVNISTPITVNNFSFGTNSTVNLLSGGSITVNGNWTQSGNARFSANFAETQVIFPSGTHTVSGTTNFSTVNVQSGSTVSVNSGSTAGITKRLSIASGGTWNNNGLTILRSSSVGTGQLAEMVAGANYNGNLSVERWADPSEGQVTGNYYMLGTPISGQNLNNWQAFNEMSGFPGSTTPSGNPSVWFYNPNSADTLGGWEAPTSINNGTPVGKAARIFLRRNSFFNGQGVFRLTGNPQIGAFTFSNGNVLSYCPPFSNCPGVAADSANGWNMLANPLPSQVDWDSDSVTISPDFGSTIYIWRQSQLAYGAYVKNFSEGSGTLGLTNILNSGQGFFARISRSTATARVAEAAKADDADRANVLRQGSIQVSPRITLSVNHVNDLEVRDEAILLMNNRATNGFDARSDAEKMVGPAVNVSFQASNKKLAISTVPVPTATEVYPLSVNVYKTGMYKVNFTTNNLPAGSNLYVRDNYTRVTQLVTPGTPYLFVVNANPASQGDTRFELLFAPAAANGISLANNGQLFDVFPNPASVDNVNVLFNGMGEGMANINVTDLLGRNILNTDVKVEGSDAVKAALKGAFKPGVYNVTATLNGNSVTRRLVIE